MVLLSERKLRYCKQPRKLSEENKIFLNSKKLSTKHTFTDYYKST